MPPKSNNSNSSIRDFFKPYTIPKSRIPFNDTVEEEIVVSQAKPRALVLSPKRPEHSRKDIFTSLSDGAAPQKEKERLNSEDLAIPQHDGASTERDQTLDSPVRSRPATQQPARSAAQIAAPPPPPPRLSSQPPSRSAAASFSSTSTLSSVPLSSQSSSKRIFKNGIYVVTNSDSGSDDSEDELADVLSFVPNKRRKLTPPAEDASKRDEHASTAKPARRSERIPDEWPSSTTLRVAPTPAPKVYKHSLLNMVKQQQKDEKAQAKIREAEAAFEAAIKKQEAIMTDNGLPEDAMAAFGDDSDEGERMRLAMARTEALQDEYKFYFFGGVSTPSQGGFEGVLVRTRDRTFKNEDARVAAFTTGHSASRAAFTAEDGIGFADEFYAWVAVQLPHESRDDLGSAYGEVLRVHASRPRSRVLRLSDFYRTGVNIDKQARINNSTNVPQSPDSAFGLQQVLSAFRHTAPEQIPDPDQITGVITDLMLASADYHVKQNMKLRNDIEDTIEHILAACPNDIAFTSLCKSVCASFLSIETLHMQVRCDAINLMPVLSERCHRLRRMLAVYLLTNKTQPADFVLDFSSPRWAHMILKQLQTRPEFTISHATDYAILASMTCVLDIAIDCGFSDFSYRAQLSQMQATTGLFGKQTATSQTEQDFNSQIDAFINQVRRIANPIRDTATTQIRRTEARSALERLTMRLEYCVRTKPRVKKGVFEGGVERQRNLLSAFLKKEGVADAEAGVEDVTIINETLQAGEISVGADLENGGAVAGAADS